MRNIQKSFSEKVVFSFWFLVLLNTIVFQGVVPASEPSEFNQQHFTKSYDPRRTSGRATLNIGGPTPNNGITTDYILADIQNAGPFIGPPNTTPTQRIRRTVFSDIVLVDNANFGQSGEPAQFIAASNPSSTAYSVRHGLTLFKEFSTPELTAFAGYTTPFYEDQTPLCDPFCTYGFIQGMTRVDFANNETYIYAGLHPAVTYPDENTEIVGFNGGIARLDRFGKPIGPNGGTIYENATVASITSVAVRPELINISDPSLSRDAEIYFTDGISIHKRILDYQGLMVPLEENVSDIIATGHPYTLTYVPEVDALFWVDLVIDPQMANQYGKIYYLSLSNPSAGPQLFLDNVPNPRAIKYQAQGNGQTPGDFLDPDWWGLALVTNPFEELDGPHGEIQNIRIFEGNNFLLPSITYYQVYAHDPNSDPIPSDQSGKWESVLGSYVGYSAVGGSGSQVVPELPSGFMGFLGILMAGLILQFRKTYR